MSYGIGGFKNSTRIRMPRRMETNPLDKCTIVNAYPKEVVAIKSTIFPGRFLVPAAPSFNDFALLTIGPSSWYKPVDEFNQILEIPCSSKQVADAIVNDHIGALPGVAGDARPAMFVILGEHNKLTVNSYKDIHDIKFETLLKSALIKQKNYYENLIKQADVLWTRTNGNPLSISDDARIAAEALGIAKNKTWMGDFMAMQKLNCPGCGNLVDPNYPICPICKAITNETLAKERGIKFAS